MNEQQGFWKEEYAEEYIRKNSNYDPKVGVECWDKILKKTINVNSILECGSNIGRNIGSLNTILPNAKKSIIEISKPSFDIVTRNYDLDKAFNGAILDSGFNKNSFDLVFTSGVLIHIHPDEVLANMKKMYEYSNQYIMLGEYFNRTPVMIDYQGQKNKLFKQDFGKLFIEEFDVTLLDYGFLWGHIYDVAGFDDITWWLFEKK